jgi:hypothetical protein
LEKREKSIIIYGEIDINSYMKSTVRFTILLAIIVLLIIPVSSVGTIVYTSTSLYGTKQTSLLTDDIAGTTWIDLHDASSADWNGGINYGVALLLQSHSTTDKWRQIERGYFVINTTGIPPGEVATSARIYLIPSHPVDNFGDQKIGVYAMTPASYSSPANGDFSDFGSVTLGNVSFSSLSNGVTFYIDFDPSIITTNGYTAIGFRTESDGENSPPAWQNNKAASTAFTFVNLTIETGVEYNADITAVPASGNCPLAVTFTDNSDGFPESAPYDSYSLSFGDGSYWQGEWQYSGEYWFHTYHYPGTYNYSYAITDDGTNYYSNGTITVSNSTSNYYVEVHGLDTSPISGANVTIWYNGELQDWEGTSEIGRSYFDVPANRWVNGTVSKTGYQTASYNQYISTWDTWTTLTLYADNETPGSGDEYWNYIVTFRDASTLATLTNVFIDVYTDSGRTDLFTSENAPYGVWTGLLPNDTTFYFTASADNHLDLNWSYTLSGASVSVYKDMLPVSYGSLQPVLNIFVYDTYGHALNGASVTVDSDIDDGFHLTNITGYARHFCDNLAYGSSRDYTITAALGGYATESSVVTVSTQQPVVYIFLDKSVYGSVTPTGVYTPVVTPVWSGDGGTPGNIKEQLINTLMTQFGVSQLEANILIGIIITLLCAVVVGGGLASYGSGSGAGVGAMIGAVVGFSGSSIMGFFPIWILIVVIVLVFAAWFMFRGRDE